MENQLFFELIACFINEREPQIEDPIHWEIIDKIAQRHGLVPVIAYLNSQYLFCQDTAWKEKWNQVFLRTIYWQSNRAWEFEQLSISLSEQKIKHLPMKGWYLKELYPIPELRTYGDIDFLILMEDRDRCDKLMRRLNYHVGDTIEPTFSYRKNMEYYEVHTNIMDCNMDGRTDMQTYFAEAWNNASLVSGYCYKPNLEFHFIYVIVHLAKHIYAAGAGLRMYLDVALMIKKCGQDMDWRYVEEEFGKLHLTDLYHTVMQAVSQWFEVALPVEIPDVQKSTLDYLAMYTLEGDLFGKTNDRWLIQRRNKECKFENVFIEDDDSLISRIFPSADYVGRRYAFVRRYPWLLPVGWMLRMLSFLSRSKKRKYEQKRLAEVQDEDVQKYDQFMKEIGL